MSQYSWTTSFFTATTISSRVLPESAPRIRCRRCGRSWWKAPSKILPIGKGVDGVGADVDDHLNAFARAGGRDPSLAQNAKRFRAGADFGSHLLENRAVHAVHFQERGDV